MSEDYPVDLNLEDKVINLSNQGFKVIYSNYPSDKEKYSVCTHNKELIIYNCNTDIQKLEIIDRIIDKYKLNI